MSANLESPVTIIRRELNQFFDGLDKQVRGDPQAVALRYNRLSPSSVFLEIPLPVSTGEITRQTRRLGLP
jgi:hypothetical protein